MRTPTKARRRIPVMAAGLAVLLAPLAVGASSASAAARSASHPGTERHTSKAAPVSPAGTIDGGYSLISSNSGGANLRVSATTNSASYEYLGNGTEVKMLCWTTGQSVSPPSSNYTSNRWFKVEPAYDFTIGYVHSSLVTYQATVPACS